MGNLFLPDLTVAQSFARSGNQIRRTLSLGHGTFRSSIAAPKDVQIGTAQAWTVSYLRGARIAHPPPTSCLTMVDLFCGAGGLAYGFCEAAASMGIEIRPRLAIDSDESALAIYQRNIGVDAPLTRDISGLIDYKVTGSGLEARFGYKPTILEPLVADLAHGVDLVVAGPPCQGHSNLNNRTRRHDERNLLYLTAPAFAVAVGARTVVIENVPEVLNDRHNVVATARALLVKAGFSISEAVLSSHRFGVAQTRRRHFLVGIRNSKIEFNLTDLTSGLEVPGLAVGHVLKDLLGKEGQTFFHTTAKISDVNKGRIDWLFDEDKNDLPDHIRPRCHQNGHTYKSVYGRLIWDKPAGTITTGFLTPGRGRYIHPKERRTLTPHEGARIQGFPDTFQFVSSYEDVPFKNMLSKVIGDAVPPLLGRAVGTIALALNRLS